jgi:hypothetical protein
VYACTVAHRIRLARIHRPYTSALAVILPIPGILAVIYGDEVSQALSNISAGILSRFMGAALLIGGVMIMVGIIRGKSLVEAVGLTLMAAGCAIYGLGVILGLGLAGSVAGAGFLAIAVGTILRVMSLTAVAREVDARHDS